MPAITPVDPTQFYRGQEAAQQAEMGRMAVQQRIAQMAQAQRATQAQSQWGPVLNQIMQNQGGAQPQMPPPGAMPPPPGLPPMPGTPQGGPQPPMPGQSSVPMGPPGMPQPIPNAPPGPAQGAAPMGGAPIPPFKPMSQTPPPQAAGGAPGGPPGAIPPPPPPDQNPQMQAAEQFSLPNILKALQKAQVPPEQWGSMLDTIPAPVKDNAAQQIKMLDEQNKALRDWANLQVKSRDADERARANDIRIIDEQRKKEQGDARIAIARERGQYLKAKTQAAAGGTGALKSVELLYPKGADGRPDESQPPIGSRGVTKTGKIITLDADGNPTTQGDLKAGSAKEAKDVAKAEGGAGGAVRNNLVRSGVTNSLARLNEIEKAFPTGTTSSFFGQHADNPMTRGMYGAAKGMQSKDQQNIDAKWASMIDEAIPVFTGGLRGSDAFRRFLIEQAPGPGDRPETVKEKMRLFRQNIEGTSKAFFSKFKSDPSMWAPGVSKEQVDALGAPAGAATPAAPSGAEETKQLGGKTYVKRGGQWYEQ